MSAFSFTAPFITEEEEIAERQAMEEDERVQVHKDMFGNDDDDQAEPLPALAPTELATKIQQVREALLLQEEESPLLSATQTLAYRQAVTTVPALVEEETDWAGFLRLVDHNPLRAAERVARYWHVRTEIFGPKAHLPMTLQGALADEIALMELGLAFCLPTDTHGRAVLFLDRTRFTLRVAPRESFLRVLFYMLYAMAGKDIPRKGEYVLVANVKGFDLYKHFDRILLKKLLKVMDALPVTLKCLHLCSGPGSSVMSIVLPVLKFMFGKYVRLRTQIQSGSDYETTERLKAYGLEEVHSLPLVLGAIYNQEQCAEFLKEQRKKERLRRGVA